jgi:hypothetical protein
VPSIVGQPPFTCQWSKDGSVISDGPHYSGATIVNLTITNFSPTDSGAYQVIVSNLSGSATNQSPLAFYASVIPDVAAFQRADLFFYIPCGLAGVSFFGSLAIVCYGVLRGDDYEYMPTSILIAEAVNKIRAENPQADIRASFIENFGNQYCQCADTNWKSNLARNKRVDVIFVFMVVCLIFLVLSLPDYLSLKAHAETKPTEVKILSK